MGVARAPPCATLFWASSTPRACRTRARRAGTPSSSSLNCSPCPLRARGALLPSSTPPRFSQRAHAQLPRRLGKGPISSSTLRLRSPDLRSSPAPARRRTSHTVHSQQSAYCSATANTVASRDCLGCVIESVESDVGDAAALSLRSIRKFNSLDGSYGLCEVLLFVQIVVSDRNIVHLTKIAKVISTSGLEGKKESAEKQDPHPLEKSPRKQHGPKPPGKSRYTSFRDNAIIMSAPFSDTSACQANLDVS